MVEPTALDDEPWRLSKGETRYLPIQAAVGDFALFFRKAAVEITFEEDRYLVVPQAAILVLVRREDIVPTGDIVRKEDVDPLDQL